MVRYEKLSSSELDQLLLQAYFPKKKERINFSDRDNFMSMIIPMIEKAEVTGEFSSNLLILSSLNNVESKKELAYRIIVLDIIYLKMAALKTIHEYKEFFDL